jgi:hypothetical protein
MAVENQKALFGTIKNNEEPGCLVFVVDTFAVIAKTGIPWLRVLRDCRVACGFSQCSTTDDIASRRRGNLPAEFAAGDVSGWGRFPSPLAVEGFVQYAG